MMVVVLTRRMKQDGMGGKERGGSVLRVRSRWLLVPSDKGPSVAAYVRCAGRLCALSCPGVASYYLNIAY